jgi:hypothetical protein
MSAERRRHPRLRRDIGDVVVSCGGVRVVVAAADVENVSVGGVAVAMRPLPLGASAQVELMGADVPLSMLARVVRVRLDGRARGAPVPTGVALAFVEPQPSRWATLLGSGE